ncbi:glycoside hydrolase family 15 protein [bacterium]|nr:glycoside hydrolase family 15 protein [bacterium]
MPRDLPIGNGRMLVNFDAGYRLRDFYYPRVGQENQTMGFPCRFGVWVDGEFRWVDDAGWERKLDYADGLLITSVHLYHPRLKLHLTCQDMVDCQETIYFKRIDVRNEEGRAREVRLFFHHDFRIYADKTGDTAYYEPVNDVLIHYKGRRYFLINGTAPGADPASHKTIHQYCTGVKEFGGQEGSWRDAEDGELSMNPITQGSVDSTFSLRHEVGPGQTARFHYWIAADLGYFAARNTNLTIFKNGPDFYFERTAAHWRGWLGDRGRKAGDLPEDLLSLYRRSLLIIRSQIDDGGAILAANDGDSREFNMDTYSYMWPRDGALVAHALDRAGYPDLTRKFFEFCAKLMPPKTFYHEGYLLHKFNPDGSLGSSWHPWVRDGGPSLPIQEDETALVLWALGEHYARRKDLAFVRDLYEPLIKPATSFMIHYRDETTGLPRESYDLWEERYGVLTFTTSAVVAGLRAGAYFAGLFKDAELSKAAGDAAETMRAALKKILYRPELGRYARMVSYDRDGRLKVDPVLDSSLFGLFAFGAFPADDPQVEQTMRRIEQDLRIKTDVGGIARYTNDYYHRKSSDIDKVPGNPWLICTMWVAQWLIARAKTRADLAWPRDILSWVAVRALQSGVLAEQVHPLTGEPLSVSPLTWSHATLVETVHQYEAKWGNGAGY